MPTRNTSSGFWAGPETDDPNAQSDTGPTKDAPDSPVPQDWKPPEASADPGAAQAPGPSDSPSGLGGAGAWGGGTGYISMADYIHGNQAQIDAERNAIGANAEQALGKATDTYHTSADAAAKKTADAERAAMNDAYGFDTGAAYRQYEDYRATRAAHPDDPWMTQPGQAVEGSNAQTGAPEWGVSKANELLTINGQPISGTGTNNDAANPYDLSTYKGDLADIENRVGNTSEGAKAAADYEALGNEGAKMANLANWGGVFDAIRGQQGAGFDATLIGRGLAGEAEKGKLAQGDAKKYLDAAITAGMGKNDLGDYKGVDRYTAKPPDNTPQQGEPQITGYGDNGPIYGGGTGPQGSNKNTTSPTVDNTGAGPTGYDAQGNPIYPQIPNPDYIPNQTPPDQDPYNWGTAGGG